MKQNIIRFLFLPIMVVAGSGLASAASISFSLTADACTGTCGTGPFGLITLTSTTLGGFAAVSVNETLAPTERFAGGGAGDALGFQIAGTVSITSLTANFAVGSGSQSFSAFGTFNHFIICSTCQGGQVGNPAGPLSFVVSRTGADLTIADFVTDSTGVGYFFASDIVGNNGNTGNVAATTSTHISATPEPSSLVMLGSGLAALGFIRRRQNR